MYSNGLALAEKRGKPRNPTVPEARTDEFDIFWQCTLYTIHLHVLFLFETVSYYIKINLSGVNGTVYKYLL